MAECALSHWSHLCTCSHKLSWVVRHDVIFKNSIKRYAWKTGYSLFPGSPSSLDLVPGRKQPVKTSAPVSNRSSERAARAPYARGVVKIHRAACACAYSLCLSLHLHSDGSATAHSIFCSSSVRALGVPQRERWVELPPHRFSAGVCTSTAFWIKVNIQGINSLIHLTPGSYWYQRTAVGKELTRCCWITRFEQRTWDCCSSPSKPVWNWEYLLLQTSAACHMRLYYVHLGHSGTLSDGLYIFALTDLKDQSMKSMAMNMGQQKRNVFSLSTGTCCHRRLQKQMLWVDIKTSTV